MTSSDVLEVVRNPVRLAALRRLGVLDTPAEPAFDRLTRLASRLLGVPVALVSLVDEDRQFFKSALGLPDPWAARRETPLTHSFCKHVVASGAPLIVEDARQDPLLSSNQAIPDLGVTAYAGVPLALPSGHVLGAMCTIDGDARCWSDEEIDTLRDLAAVVMTELQLRSELQRRRQIEDELRTAKESAEDANRAKSLFLTNMSHELRSPLNSIIGFASVLLRSAGKEEGLAARHADFIERIRLNGCHLLELINELLDLAKIESGQVEVEMASVALPSLVAEVCSELEGQVTDRPVRLIQEVPPSVLPVEADERKLKQVLINLAGNAIKFTERGTVTVRVEVDAGRRPVALEVVDTGIGIPEERQEAIFEAFQQVDNSTSRDFGGTGLGLAISKSLLEHMGFELSLDSRPERGSKFRIDLSPRPSGRPARRRSVG